MPDYDPPADYDGTPRRYLLPAGSTLWHIHPKNRKATDFTPYRQGRRSGAGRFDGPYPAYNAGLDAATTLAELLLGSIPLPAKGFRTLRRASVAGRRVSAVATAAELSLVSLCDAVDLAAVAQDVWLIHAEDCHDPRVRRWAEWLRAQAPWAAGFIWPPRRDVSQRAVVLFGDRCDSGALDPEPLFGVDLDDEYGAVWLNGILVRYRVRIMPPAK
ncbi:MAG TPA: RES family NAD+ phosphorylase [Amycolatopsis sp.]|uniref:RES family NAD+ phosphorylase n=1 Tax=Amycolatopsis sp. TaxID=37632 RepID=UPI002B48BA77|nr:RES family NAD+ phosphorylase [Amycolatopsis sp.]HKS48314.1 RES family NAD+ phosphorylase [Amycolatopsis sp.]